MVVLFNLCGDALESNDYSRDVVYSRVGRPQHPYSVVRIVVLFLTSTGFGKSGYCRLTSARGQGTLLWEARGMTRRTECVNYLRQLDIPLRRASFLPDPAWPRALRMRSQNEVTGLANANPQSVFLQTAHIHMWVEGGREPGQSRQVRKAIFSSLLLVCND